MPDGIQLLHERRKLKKNLLVLQGLLDDGTVYPELSKRLRSHKASLGNRIMSIHNYALAYGETDVGQVLSWDDARGFEYMASFQRLSDEYGGSVETWWKNIQLLAAIGLLNIHKPGENEDRFNTELQRISVKRAQENKEQRRPVNWYGFPAYTSSMLEEAESRAIALKGVGSGSINKDVVRDLLGDAEANRAYNTGKSIRDSAQALREAIKAVVVAQTEEGYTTPEAVLSKAYGLVAGEDVSEAQTAADEGMDIFNAPFDYESVRLEEKTRMYLRHTWSAYRPKLFAELGLKYSAPTKEERERFDLHTGKWIIRKA